MTIQHDLRIVQQGTPGAWALYCDGVFQDCFDSTCSARRTGLARYARHAALTLVIRIEDTRGRTLSTERIVHPI